MLAIRHNTAREARSWEGTPYVDHQGVKHAGVDCFFLPTRVYQAVGLMPKDFSPPPYSPQQWLNSPSQTDKMHLRVEDRTAIEIVEKYSYREISESAVRMGDLIVYKIVNSWTHGAIVIEWPGYIVHAVKGLGVIGSHGTNEGMVKRLGRRYFTFVKEDYGII
jgi:cell wall-associated NlpC family hydrolase